MTDQRKPDKATTTTPTDKQYDKITDLPTQSWPEQDEQVKGGQKKQQLPRP